MNWDILGRINRMFNYTQSNNDNYYTFQPVGTTTPDWIDTTNKFLLYDQIPELQAVINRYANLVSSAKPIIKDSDGVVIQPNGNDIFRLLNRPNAMQSWDNFIYFLAVNDCVTSNIVALKNKTQITQSVRSLTPIAYNNIKIVATGKSYKQISINGIIKEFHIPLNVSNTFETFKPNEVIYIARPDGINLYNTNSRIDALKYPLSNLAKTYEKRNVILKNMFALGILSSDNNDGVSSIPLDDNEKIELQRDLMRRHNGKVIVTDKAMNWQPMSYPTKDLMLFEEMTADKAAIIDAYGLNVNMFAPIDNKGQTFSNVEMGYKQAYQSTIIPDAENLYAEIGRQIGLEDQGLYLCPDFSHIQVLASDKQKDADTLLKNTQSLMNIREMGVTLTREEERTILGL